MIDTAKVRQKIRGNAKSKTTWTGVVETSIGVLAYLLLESPEVAALVAAYGPQALIVFGVAKVVLRNVTDRAVDHK